MIFTSHPLSAEIKSPIRFLYLGGIIVGAELINGAIKIFSKKNAVNQNDIKMKQQEELNKQKELEQLLAPSKLLDMVKTSTNQTQATNTVSPLPNQFITNLRNESMAFYITNNKTKEVYEFKQGEIDYYDVGVAYFRVNKKEKAKEFLFKAIQSNINKNKAINFLIENYNMSPKEINRETTSKEEE